MFSHDPASRRIPSPTRTLTIAPAFEFRMNPLVSRSMRYSAITPRCQAIASAPRPGVAFHRYLPTQSVIHRVHPLPCRYLDQLPILVYMDIITVTVRSTDRSVRVRKYKSD